MAEETTQDKIDEIDEVIEGGAASVKHTHKSVTHWSLEDLRSIRRSLDRQAQGSTRRRPNAGFGSFRRGR